VIPRLGGAESDEGFEVFGRPEGFILKQGADGMPVADICRKAGISQATYFNWKKKYGGLLPTEMRRLKQLEDENSKPRKVVADLSLDKEMPQDALRRKL
jgi:putative transposase